MSDVVTKLTSPYSVNVSSVTIRKYEGWRGEDVWQITAFGFKPINKDDYDEDEEYESSFDYIYSHDTMSSEEMKTIVDNLMKDEVPTI